MRSDQGPLIIMLTYDNIWLHYMDHYFNYGISSQSCHNHGYSDTHLGWLVGMKYCNTWPPAYVYEICWIHNWVSKHMAMAQNYQPPTKHDHFCGVIGTIILSQTHIGTRISSFFTRILQCKPTAFRYLHFTHGHWIPQQVDDSSQKSTNICAS